MKKTNFKKVVKTFFALIVPVLVAVYAYFFISIYRGGTFANVENNVENFTEEEITYEIIDFGGYNWLILDEQNGWTLLLMENTWTSFPYHENRKEVTWENSSLRQILNDDFYNSMPNENRERIVKTSVSNSENQWFRTDGGADTKDYVFLLSLEEVIEYFGDSGYLGQRPAFNHGVIARDINDQYNSARIAYDSLGNTSVWWLRSPGGDSNRAANITNAGLIHVRGNYVDTDYCGVRPAMWINL